MNTILRLFLCLVLALGWADLQASSNDSDLGHVLMFAQASAPAVDPGSPELKAPGLPDFLTVLLGQYPWATTALILIGGFRLAIKPLFSFAHSLVDSTPSPSDNEILAKVEGSRITKAIFFVLDWLASVKIKK